MEATCSRMWRRVRKRRSGGIEGRSGKPRQRWGVGENVIGRLNWIERGMGLGIVERDVV